MPPEWANLSETLGIRGGRLKRQWLLTPNPRAVGEQALNTYWAGFEAAKNTGDVGQQYYNGINVAYMTFALGKPGFEAIADEVLKCCAQQTSPDYWADASRAEAYLLLRKYPEAPQAYHEALGHSPFRSMISTATGPTW